MTEPTGQLSPFDRQNVIESASRVSSATGASSATAALKMRAPSMCSPSPLSCATSAIELMSSWVSAAPPQEFWVFSKHTSEVRGMWGSFGRMAARTSSGSSIPRASFGTVWNDIPPSTDDPPASLRKMCDWLPRIISSPRVVCASTDTRLPIVPAGYEYGGLLAEPLCRHRLQPVQRGVVAEHVVAEFSLVHRPPHLLGRMRNRVAAQIHFSHSPKPPYRLARGSCPAAFILSRQDQSRHRMRVFNAEAQRRGEDR